MFRCVGFFVLLSRRKADCRSRNFVSNISWIGRRRCGKEIWLSPSTWTGLAWGCSARHFRDGKSTPFTEARLPLCPATGPQRRRTFSSWPSARTWRKPWRSADSLRFALLAAGDHHPRALSCPTLLTIKRHGQTHRFLSWSRLDKKTSWKRCLGRGPTVVSCCRSILRMWPRCCAARVPAISRGDIRSISNRLRARTIGGMRGAKDKIPGYREVEESSWRRLPRISLWRLNACATWAITTCSPMAAARPTTPA